MPPPPNEPNLLTLTIEIEGSSPRIWRRLALPGDLTLDAVHTLLQAAMGWTDSHLHRFQPGLGYDQPYFITEFDEAEGEEGTREDGVRLDQLLHAPGDRLIYLYDFGDGWQHQVQLESVTALTADSREPECMDGAGSCPPEDVGGLHGHHEVAVWLRAGAPADDVPEGFENAAHAHSWLPDGYDPDAFDADETTATMRLWAAGKHVPWYGVPAPLADLVQRLRGDGWLIADTWLTALGPREPVVLDEEPLRGAARPWLALLDAIGSKTTLTAAGYLPPVVVSRIVSDAGITDWWLGKTNREDVTRPVAELRETALQVGLLRKVKGTLVPTARAKTASRQPRTLVSSVLQRLPFGTQFEVEAGWFLLLGLAAGESKERVDDGVAQMMSDRGWRMSGETEVNTLNARGAARLTRNTLQSMAGGRRDSHPGLVTQLARAALFGLADSR